MLGVLDRGRIGQCGQVRQLEWFGDGDQVDHLQHWLRSGADAQVDEVDQRR